MPLTLVLGPANSAKAGEVLGAYAAAAHRGALLVVPTALDAGHYTRELAQQGVVLGSVLTFSGLAREVARRAGYRARRLSALQRERILRRVIEANRLSAIERSAGTRGFASVTGNLIAELQRAMVTPRRFTQAMRSWAANDERRGPYADDVASLYGGYVRELDRLDRVDGELYAWRALDALRLAPAGWGNSPVFFYGFDDLHALERDAVETLSRIVGAEVTVSLTYEPGRSALIARAEAVEGLRPLAERVIELPSVDEHYEPASRAALHHLERRLFEPGSDGPRIDPGSAVRLLEAGGERAEAELVAAEVLALMGAGIPGEEIVVVYRSIAGAVPVVSGVFSEYGIELATDYRIPFGQTALGRGVLALARCGLLPEAAATDLISYLRCPGIVRRLELVDRLEADVRREALRTASEARERLGWRLEEIDALRDAADPLAELARHARRLFAAPHPASAPALGADEELDARALTTLLRALGELDELGLGKGLEGHELIELLERLEVPAGVHAGESAVLLAEPLAIRARRFRAVFVCGLREGEFPRPGTPEPFLGDERRHELAASAGLRLAGGEDALARERYLFYACVSRATEQLVLSYTSSDEEGNLVLPSPFIADVEDLLVEGWAERRRRRLLADVVWTPEGAPTARERARAEATGLQLGADSAAETPARALSELALERIRHRQILSAGALESYADCPVKWFVERELAPARFEPEPDPIARGSYIHAALEELFRRLDGPLSEVTLQSAMRILDEVLAELPAPVAPGRGESIRAAAVRAIEADLGRYLAQEAADGCEWEPEGLELRFGFAEEEHSLPALELGAGVSLRGVIDRVDVEAGQAIVRDYKSGSSRSEHPVARWRSDRQLQVALYMLVVRELLKIEPVAGLYQPLSGRDLRPRGVFVKGAPVGPRVVSNDARTQEELDEVLADASERAVEIAARLRSGELTPCPQTCSRNGCMYPGICRST